MRPILALVILLLGLSSAAPEPEYSSFFNDYPQAANGGLVTSLVEIESSTGRADRLRIASLLPHRLAVDTIKRADVDATANIDIDIDAGAEADLDVNAATGTDVANAPDHPATPSLADLCTALYMSAQSNDLPVAFFANLIWQESRLREDAVSSKGALGIAQFMPQTAAETGLENPFDPMQAIPASARFLRMLRQEFGNLGFVAAAYNAGAHRVADWLLHRSSLPRETLNYVVRVTGLTAEAWRKLPIDDAALTFVPHLPCRDLPAFASLEQAQLEQAQLEQAKLALEEAKLAAQDAAEHSARRKLAYRHVPRDKHNAAREHSAREGHAGKHEAAHRPRVGREKRKSA